MKQPEKITKIQNIEVMTVIWNKILSNFGNSYSYKLLAKLKKFKYIFLYFRSIKDK